MNNMMKNLLLMVLLLAGSTLATAAELGKDYKLLTSPQPASTKKIEVLEFFFYGCSHCYNLHPMMSMWEKTMPSDVELVYVPTIFRSTWEPMARTYYALEALGLQHQLHDTLYKAWNVENEVLSEDTKAINYVAAHGVDRAKFTAAYNSFSMQSKVARAKQMIRSYAITGTPTLIVDGKYVISGLHPPETIRALNDVIEMVRKERSARH